MSRRKEEWRDVPGYDGFYQVSDWGRVRSFRTNGPRHTESRLETPRLLKPQFLHGTVCVRVRENGRRKGVSVARLVVMTWLGGIPEGMRVFHRNEDPTNNCLRNVELKPADYGGKTCPGNRKPVLKIDLSLEIVECYSSARQAARKSGFSHTTIQDYCNLVQRGTIVAPDGFIYAWDDEVWLDKTLERARRELEAKGIRYNDPHTARYYDLPQEFEMDVLGVSWAEVTPTQAVGI